MPRKVRTARGDIVDFDALILKQQIAEAPMSIEVARRKAFIDNKEGRGRGQRQPSPQVEEVEEVEEAELAHQVEDAKPAHMDFELDNPEPKKKK